MLTTVLTQAARFLASCPQPPRYYIHRAESGKLCWFAVDTARTGHRAAYTDELGKWMDGDIYNEDTGKWYKATLLMQTCRRWFDDMTADDIENAFN